MIKEGAIYATENKLIKVLSIDKETCFGYELDTGNLIKLKNESLKPLPDYIKLILGSENIRLQIAKSFVKTDKKAADLMGINVRTVYRIKNT